MYKVQAVFSAFPDSFDPSGRRLFSWLKADTRSEPNPHRCPQPAPYYNLKLKTRNFLEWRNNEETDIVDLDPFLAVDNVGL